MMDRVALMFAGIVIGLALHMGMEARQVTPLDAPDKLEQNVDGYLKAACYVVGPDGTYVPLQAAK